MKKIKLISIIEEKCPSCQAFKKFYIKDKDILWVDKDEFFKKRIKADKKNTEKELRKRVDLCPNLYHKETGFFFIGKSPELARSFINGYLHPERVEKNIGKLINGFIGKGDLVKIKTT